MSDSSDLIKRVDLLEKKLYNTEVCLMSALTLINKSMPMNTYEDLSQLIEEYFEANGRLGSFKEDSFFIP